MQVKLITITKNNVFHQALGYSQSLNGIIASGDA
jgi:hypothetical protein